MQRRYVGGALVAAAAVLALLPGTTKQAARADTTGTPTRVGSFGCIVDHGGNVTRPAGSTIIIGQALGEQTLGIMNNLLSAETTIVSVNDGRMFDVSNQWSTPVQQPDGSWLTTLNVPTGVTLAQ